MKPLDIVIIAAIAACAVFALIYCVKRKGKGCTGDCANCGSGCSKRRG